MFKPVLIVVLVLAVLLAAAWLGQRRLIYLPDRGDVPSVASYFPSGQDVTLSTSDGLTLGAWYVPPGGAGPASQAGRGDRELTVLVAPGNAGNREGRAPLAEMLSEAGFAVLLFDYRGYGGNPGSPTETGLQRDVRAAHDHLVHERGVRPDRLIYFGESLGCAVVAELATGRPPGGMLLRSPFTDLAAAGAANYPFLPVRLLLWDRFPVTEHVARLGDLPVAVVYGGRDSIVPPQQSQTVAQRVGNPVAVTEVAGADHNDSALFTGPQVLATVLALAEEIDSDR